MSASPILMYHQIVSSDPKDIHAVSVRAFAHQMRWLHEHGYQATAVEDLLSTDGARRASPASRRMAITFDDGYLDCFTNALPILSAYGFTATIFLVASRIGGVNDWDRTPELAGAPLLDWPHLQELSNHGMRFGAHTCTHPDLTRLPAPQAQAEIEASRTILQQRLQVPVRGFAYPYSRLDDKLMKMVGEAGFELGCTYEPGYVGGPGSCQFALQRTGVLATDTMEGFSGKVQAGFRWRVGWLRRKLRSYLKTLAHNR